MTLTFTKCGLSQGTYIIDAAATRELINQIQQEENSTDINWRDLLTKKQITEQRLNETVFNISGTILELKPIDIAAYIPLNESFSNNNLSPKEMVDSIVDGLTIIPDAAADVVKDVVKHGGDILEQGVDLLIKIIAPIAAGIIGFLVIFFIIKNIMPEKEKRP